MRRGGTYCGLDTREQIEKNQRETEQNRPLPGDESVGKNLKKVSSSLSFHPLLPSSLLHLRLNLFLHLHLLVLLLLHLHVLLHLLVLVLVLELIGLGLGRYR